MLLAIDDKNNRIYPYKGGAAKCSICQGRVIAICGVINIHHWRHEFNPNCDTWQEHETEWHRSWKNEFPKEWQEIVIKEDNEIHRADIKTSSGLVLELQNSPILAPVIEAREMFYKKMIWLINANNFKDNFEIYSIVNAKLRENENYYKEYNYGTGDIYESILKDELAGLIPKRDSLIRRVDSRESIFDGYNNDLENLDKEFSKVLSAYSYHDNFTSKNKLILDIKEFNGNIKLKRSDKAEVKKKIALIESLEFTQINGYEEFRYVTFSLVNASSFRKCKIVITDSINRLFPEIIDIESELSFNSYSNRRDVTLMINLADDLLASQESCIHYNGSISGLNYLIKRYTKELKVEFELYLKAMVDKFKNELVAEQNLLRNIESKIDSKAAEVSAAEEEAEKLLEELKVNRQKERTEKEIEIKKKFKGRYTYHWKHKRKSWNFSRNKLFLDFDSHIFQIKNDKELKKMDKQEFIDLVKNWV